MSELDLTTRTGWPDDLRVLLQRYPREVWASHANLGDTARFWLRRHDMFRSLGASLQLATEHYHADRLSEQEFRPWFVPRLQFFLSELHAHHQVEDHNYFPLFRAAEPRLQRGFEVLEGDHEAIHALIEQVAVAANTLLQSGTGDATRTAADAYAGVSGKLVGGLIRHLADEEDLIIPLILDRGEAALEIG